MTERVYSTRRAIDFAKPGLRPCPLSYALEDPGAAHADQHHHLCGPGEHLGRRAADDAGPRAHPDANGLRLFGLCAGLRPLSDPGWMARGPVRSEEHTSELQSRSDLVCRLLLEKKNVSAVSVRGM